MRRPIGVCIGDRWRICTSIAVVTQGRQPCFKPNLRFGVPDTTAGVQNTLHANWYLRLEQPDEVAAGDGPLLDRPHPAFSVAHLLALIRDWPPALRRSGCSRSKVSSQSCAHAHRCEPWGVPEISPG